MIPLAEQIVEVERELALRGRVYPSLIAQGRLNPEFAARSSDRMQAVLETLQTLQKETLQ